jgi:antitoxin (DNA-binding transcriptional repressor) of toxin-antitoxin stability system
MYTFSAQVRKIDINPYVQVPDETLLKLQKDARKEKGPIPVKGTLQGKPFLANVVRYRGMWRLYLNTDMRRAANADIGDQVTVAVQYDAIPRTVPVPRKFTLALSKNKRAKEAFEKLAPSRQKEILRYLKSLKQPQSLERNIEKIIGFLKGEPVEGLVAVTRRKRQDTN